MLRLWMKQGHAAKAWRNAPYRGFWAWHAPDNSGSSASKAIMLSALVGEAEGQRIAGNSKEFSRAKRAVVLLQKEKTKQAQVLNQRCELKTVALSLSNGGLLVRAAGSTGSTTNGYMFGNIY